MSKLLEQINTESRIGSIKDLVFPVSNTYDFSNKDKVVFVNTGDVHEGKFIHKNYSSTKKLPGQAKKIIEFGDIVFSEIRPKNRHFALVDFDSKDYVVSTKLIVLRIKENIDPRFAYIVLTADQNLREFQNIAESRSGTFPQITFEAIADYEVNIPDLPTQKKIAEILGAYDAKIENNNKIIKNLEATAQAIFNEWFVNFRFPGHEKVKMVDSEMGEIPEKWRVGRLSELLKVKHGFAFSGNKFKNEGIYPVIKIKNILENNTVNLDKVDFIDINDFGGILENFEIFNGDILIAMTGATSGKIAVLMDNYDRYFLNQRVGKFEFLKEENRWFSYIYLTQEQNRNLLLTMSDGSAQGNLSPKQVENLETIIPDEIILKLFNKIIKSMFENKFFLQLENNELKESRNQLLAKLI